MKWAISLTLIIGILVTTMMGCTTLGSRPTIDAKKQFENSAQYNSERGIFENRRPNLVAEMQDRSMNWSLVKEWFSGGEDRVPSERLPEVKPNLEAFLEGSETFKVIWFGHSSFLLNLDGVTILVDPVFGKAASPFSFMVKRFQEPVLSLEELPEIDYILISHDHYDHLDKTSIQHFVDTETQFITPLGVDSHLEGWGIDENRITERDWWQSINTGGIEFIATPAQHFSGRDGFHSNETLWASWVIRSKNHNIYFSGDSGYDTHFKAIGEAYGPFDIAFIESGQYNESWREVHMLPEESMQAFKDLKADRYFPIHWGMFELAFHSWYEPVERLSILAEERNVELLTPRLGEIVTLDGEGVANNWWRQLVKPILDLTPVAASN